MDWLNLSPDEWSAVRLSLKVATWAMLASLPFGIAVALLLARRDFRGKSLVDGIVHLRALCEQAFAQGLQLTQAGPHRLGACFQLRRDIGQ